MLSLLQKCAAYQDLPTLQFWSKSHYPFWPIMQIRKKGGWNLKKIFSKFELYKHNDELFNIYYGIFYELWTFTDFDRLWNKKKGGMKLKKNLLLWNYWANFNQTLLKWSLGDPLLKLCPSAASCIQDGRHY